MLSLIGGDFVDLEDLPDQSSKMLLEVGFFIGMSKKIDLELNFSH
jgi:hypothetical protein